VALVERVKNSEICKRFTFSGYFSSLTLAYPCTSSFANEIFGGKERDFYAGWIENIQKPYLIVV